MKGGGLLGSIGGILATSLLAKGGSSLLAKGGMKAGSSLLGSVVSGLISSGGGGRGGGGGMGGGRGGGGGCGGGGGMGGRGGSKGMGGGRGGGGGMGGEESELSAVLQKALMRAMKNTGSSHGRKSAGENEDGEIIDVTSQSLPQEKAALEAGTVENAEQTLEQKKLALAVLTEVLTSYIPGRARFRHQGFKDVSGVEAVKSELLQMGFLDVEWKPSTGSVLLTWDENKWEQSEFFASALPLGEYLLGRVGA